MHITSSAPLKGEAEAAWRVLMDFAAYESWNPFVVKAETEDRRRVRLWLDPAPEDRMISVDVRIDESKAPHYLRGALNYGPPGLLGGRYALSIDAATHTLTQEVKLTGCLQSVYVSERFRRLLQRGLDAMGAAVAKRSA